MIKKFLFLLNFIITIPGILSAQLNSPSASGPPETGSNVMDPEKFFQSIVVGLSLAFTLFIVFALSRATSALSETLGKRYLSYTSSNKN